MNINNLGGWQTHNPPFNLGRTLCYGFWLGADKATIQRSVDAYLNEGLPDNIVYKVLAGKVLASLVVIQNVTCAEPPQSNEGWMSEQDFAFFVVLARLERLDGIWVPRQLVMLPVFLMVDNPLAVAAGREVYGFPKSLAQINGPALGTSDPISVTTLAFKNYHPEAQLLPLEIIRVTCEPPAIDVPDSNAANAPTEQTFDSADGWLRSLFEHAFDCADEIVVEGLGTAIKWADHILEQQATLVFRKQFPDVTGQTTACYSAIIEAPLKVTKFLHGGLLPGNRMLHIEPADSLPIAKFLGFPLSSNAVELAFYSQADFQADLGKVIYRFN